MILADNFAWMWTYRFFTNKWSWSVYRDPAASVLTFPDNPYYGAWTMPDIYDASSIPTTNTCPLNCVDTGSNITCAYLGESYDNWLLDAGYPCVCTENGCSGDSPSYCDDSSCPVCDYNDNGYTNGSPACYDSGTCQWAT